jgi:hypothetical protein
MAYQNLLGEVKCISFDNQQQRYWFFYTNSIVPLLFLSGQRIF